MRAATNLYSNLNAAMQSTESSLQSSVNQLSSGKRVSNPADDPIAFSQNLQSLASSARVDRYTTNADAVLAQSQMADAALSTVVTSLTSAVSLTTQGGDVTLTSTQRNDLAGQITTILQTVLSQANTTAGGTALFGGTSASSVAFAPDPSNPGSYLYQGTGQTNQVAVGDAMNVPTGVPGDAIFTSSAGNVIGSLQQAISALQSGDPNVLADANASLTAAIKHVDQVRSVYAGTANQLTAQTSFLSNETVTLSSQQQNLVSADIATTATALTQAQIAHSAVLAVAAKILPESLLNYLH